MVSSRLTPVVAATCVAIGLAACGSKSNGVQFTAAAAMSTPTSVGTAPMLAVSNSGTMASAWVSAPGGGIDGRLYINIGSADPVELSDALGPVEGKGESPPKLAYGADGSLNAIYVVDKDDPKGKQPLEALRFVRSTDSGKTWTKAVTVTGDNDFGVHNFHALHIGRDGTMYVSWLGRDSTISTPWIAHSTDGGVTWSHPVQVDNNDTCDCCRTGLASAADGTLYMAWRHIFEGSIRDVVVARSDDHGSTWSAPVRVHADNWVFNGCPRAGPSIQVDSTGTVHVAWWTGKAGGAGVWYVRSEDGGKTFGKPEALGVAPTSRPAHVQLALGAHSTIAAIWDDGTAATPRIVFRLSRDGGKTFGKPDVLSAEGRAVGFPVVVFSPRELTAAWTETGAATPSPATTPMPNMSKGAMTHRGIKPIGDGQIMVRKAALPE